MRKKKLFVVAIGLLIAFSSCEKCEPECNLMAAKIIRYDCDRVILKLLSNETIGDANWKDVQTGQTYSNVVSYYNTCKVLSLTKGEKLTLYVALKQPNSGPDIPDCSRCEALSQHPPLAKIDFAEISKSSCKVVAN